NEHKKLVQLKKKTINGFGYEWTNFSKLYKEYEQQFLDWIHPITPDFFKNKLVLDAGCGTGRHSYYATRFGAETVGMDLSIAVDVAQKNAGNNLRTHIIQADIFHPQLN
ncbi:MAG: Methyltransferase type 11, partial [Berkelbacteria bacterium GW2011_GWA2_35_9]